MKINKEQWREMSGLADLDQKDLRGIARREANLVDHPVHYNQGRYEVIDVIEDWNLNFHCSNAIKYIARHGHKGDAQRDIEKAIWYLQRYLEKISNE